MGFIADLKNEITADPDSIGYTGAALPIDGGAYLTISDRVHKDPVEQAANQAIADLINAGGVPRQVARLSRTQVLSAITAADLDLATDINLAKVNLVMADSIDPWNATVVKVFQDAFGTDTTIALDALRNDTQSQAQKLGFPRVEPGHVAMARLK